MKNIKARKGMVIGLLVGLVATLHAMNQQEEQSVSFDILFPQNWYTRTLQSCMEVWADLDSVIANQEMPFEKQHLLIDASIGKISYSINCSQNPSSEVNTTINLEDISYLLKIVCSLDTKTNKLTGRRYDGKLSCLQQQIDILKKQLIQLLESDRTTFSSSE